MKQELTQEQAKKILKAVAKRQLESQGGLASAFSSQILNSVDGIVEDGYAKGLTLSIETDSKLGVACKNAGVI